MAKSKFTEEDKHMIRKLHDEMKMPYAAIALQYGVAPITINRICNPKVAEKQARARKIYRAKNIKKEAEHQKKTYRHYSVRFHREKDKDIIVHLQSKENTVDYIRTLILADMEKNREDSENPIS